MFTWPVRVYWEDTDAGGIVFYANYLKFMERARTEWLRSLGLSQSLLRQPAEGPGAQPRTHPGESSAHPAGAGGMFVVRSTQVEYLAPARLDDQLLVTAKLVESTRITLTIAQEIRLITPGKPKENVLSKLLKPEHTIWTQQELAALQVVCSGRIRIAWVDAEHLKPSRIPQHVMEILQ